MEHSMNTHFPRRGVPSAPDPVPYSRESCPGPRSCGAADAPGVCSPVLAKPALPLRICREAHRGEMFSRERPKPGADCVGIKARPLAVSAILSPSPGSGSVFALCAREFRPCPCASYSEACGPFLRVGEASVFCLHVVCHLLDILVCVENRASGESCQREIYKFRR